MRLYKPSFALVYLVFIAAAIPAPGSIPPSTITTLGHDTTQINHSLPSGHDDQQDDNIKQTVDDPTATQTAHIVVPCRGCGGSGDDELLPFEFRLPPQATDTCKSIRFYVNDIGIELTRDYDKQDTVKQSLEVELDNYNAILTAELHCELVSPAPAEGEPHWESHVHIEVDSLNDRILLDRLGYEVSLAQHPSLLISRLEIYHSAVDDGRTAVHAYSTDELEITDTTAKDLLQELKQLREELKEYDLVLIPEVEAVEEKSNDRDHVSPQDVLKEPSNKLSGFFTCIHHFFDQVQITMGHLLNGTKEKIHSCFDKSQLYSNVSTDVNDTTVFEEPTSDKEAKQAGYQQFDQSNTLVRVLEIIASAIGLTALIQFIKRRCMSLRRKVDNLADREERYAARAYRRAARREAYRQCWRRVRGVFCGPIQAGDYEEKCALILAAEEGDCQEESKSFDHELDVFERAHEIVVTRMSSNRLQRNTVAPSVSSCTFVSEPRSRAGSLPSYRADTLPEYSSAPGSCYGGGRRSVTFSLFSGRASSADPDSTIPDLSTRYSGETIRSDLSYE